MVYDEERNLEGNKPLFTDGTALVAGGTEELQNLVTEF